MSITVKGVTVRSEEVREEISMEFEDLTEEGQRRIFLENKDQFLYEALTSRYKNIRDLAGELKDNCSSNTLNDIIIIFLNKVRTKDIYTVIEILNIPNLELEEEVRKKLSTSVYWTLRLWVARDKNTSSQILKDMFWEETKLFLLYDGSPVFDAIIENLNFKLDEELSEKIQTLGPNDIFKIMTKIKESNCK